MQSEFILQKKQNKDYAMMNGLIKSVYVTPCVISFFSSHSTVCHIFFLVPGYFVNIKVMQQTSATLHYQPSLSFGMRFKSSLTFGRSDATLTIFYPMFSCRIYGVEKKGKKMKIKYPQVFKTKRILLQHISKVWLDCTRTG